MDSKSVLMIAYYFPPDGCAAVYRSLRFLKELAKKQWCMTVICCEPYQYERNDPQLLDQVPPSARVVRIKQWDPWCAFQTWRGVRTERKLAESSEEAVRHFVAGHHVPWRARLRDLVKTTEACVYRPDMAMPWIRPTTRAALAICRQDQPNVMWATIGPLSAGVVAYRTSMATGIPYVLDFRDPWGLDYYPRESRRPTWAKERDNRTISRMFERARAVVFMFESIAERYMEAFPGVLKSSNIHIIPNGFEGEVEAFAHAPGDRCAVLYAGTLNTYRYDMLLEGLAQLKRNNPERAAQLQLRFVGTGIRDLGIMVADFDIQDMVEILPPTSSAEVRRLQREAHALLVLGRASNRKGNELVAGAKLFGYLQAGRPIIGVVPYDETRRILQQIGSPMIADAGAPAEVAAVFETLLDAWLNGTLGRLVPDRAACEAYSSGRQASALEMALVGIPREKVSAAGTDDVAARFSPELAP